LFQSLAKEVGFNLKLYPVAPNNMQNQSALWLDIRRDKPDFLVMWGWGAMVPTAVKEAAKAEFPMDKFVAIWWTTDTDAAAGGDGAKGFKMVSWHGVGTNYPAFAEIKKRAIDAGKSQTPAAEFGQELYNRGVYNGMVIAEAIATAQKITGKKVVTGEDVRRGLENLDIDAARLKVLGLDGFAGPFKTTCFDHNSHSATFVQQWDGAKWVKISDLIGPDAARVEPLIDEAAKAYAEKNAGWPKRSEPCDNK
jgi:branched-chain amino acid transport system substrate-binding protein